MKLLVFLVVVSVVFGLDNETKTATTESVVMTTKSVVTTNNPEVEENNPGPEMTTNNDENDEKTTQTTTMAAKKDDSVETATTNKNKVETEAPKSNNKLNSTTPPNGSGKGERQGQTACPAGLFGPGCNLACGFCADSDGNEVECTSDGNCPSPSTCLEGWSGERCNEALCDPACQNGGTCIAPNTCDCGDNINYIAPSCEDIRVRGLIGPLIAVVTITVSISLCGFASKTYAENKAKQQPLE